MNEEIIFSEKQKAKEWWLWLIFLFNGGIWLHEATGGNQRAAHQKQLPYDYVSFRVSFASAFLASENFACYAIEIQA